MATEHVKVYEEKKGLPIWAWLIPLLLLLALLAWLLLKPKQAAVDTSAAGNDSNGRCHGSARSGSRPLRHRQSDSNARRTSNFDSCG